MRIFECFSVFGTFHTQLSAYLNKKRCKLGSISTKQRVDDEVDDDYYIFSFFSAGNRFSL